MGNLDIKVLRTLRDWRMQGKSALLATVVRTWGSSPRPVGSIMALCAEGGVVGSVSGGCIEDDLIHRYSADRFLPLPAPAFVKYGVSADEAHRFGLPCGGTLELLLETDPDPESLREVVQLLDAGNLVRRVVFLGDNKVNLEIAPDRDELTRTDTSVGNTFGPAYRMLLIGAGEIASCLATMATFSGFSVTVCEPRIEYRTTWSLPGVTLLCDMPDDVVCAFKLDRHTCVVALSHDPKLDDMALLEALNTKAFYVGAIGSRRNNQVRKQRMVDHCDQTPESLSRLRGPIGIYIGSKTPPEIAVSVMAEILAVKNGVPLPRDMYVAQAKDRLSFVPTAVEEIACGLADTAS